jgi:hypothetical protein
VEQGQLGATCPDGQPGALATEEQRILFVESFEWSGDSRGKATLRLERPRK